MNDELEDLSDSPECPLGPEFLAARERVWAQDAHHRKLLAALESGDETATRQSVSAAEAQIWKLADEALGIRAAEVAAARGDAVATRVEEVLAAPELAAIALAVSTLTKRGPMTGTELEALRLPGLSHNVVRPILRLAQQRGEVERRQSGKRVLWIATPN